MGVIDVIVLQYEGKTYQVNESIESDSYQIGDGKDAKRYYPVVLTTTEGFSVRVILSEKEHKTLEAYQKETRSDKVLAFYVESDTVLLRMFYCANPFRNPDYLGLIEKRDNEVLL